MEYRRDMIGDAVYREGVESLATEPQGDRVARWVLEFLQDPA